MFKLFGNRKTISAKRKKRPGYTSPLKARAIRLESLEPRRLLSTVGLTALPNVTLAAGTSMLVALNGNDPGQTIQYGVTSTDPTQVTPIVMPSTNKTVQFNLNNLGTISFQLFDNLTPNTTAQIEALVNGGFYNGDEIYRQQSGFVIQGGNDPPVFTNGAVTGTTSIHSTLPSGASPTINEEFNPDLSYTTAGSLAMARTTTPNTSGTEFFYTESTNDPNTRDPLDYSYTLFGFQTTDPTVSGGSTTINQAIEAMPTESGSGASYLTTPITITSASLITDTQNGVLMLRAPTGVTGNFTVTVTAFDGTNTPTTQTFTVNVVADTATGAVTDPWASQTPAAPTSVAFQPQSGQGTTTLTAANNSTAAKEMQFLVSGTTAGDTVTVFADGVAIGTAAGTAGTTTVTSNGSFAISDGTHTFSATQTAPNLSASWTDSGGSSRTETANVDSFSSAGVQLQVDTSLAITSTAATTATVGQVYTYTLQTNAIAGDSVTVTPGSMPTGMTFDGVNTFTWTPTAAQEGTTQSFTATVTDTAGNSITLGPVNVAVSSANGLTVIAPAASVAIGSPVLVGFNDTNGAAPTFTVTTSDPSHLTATLMPETNDILKIVTDQGEMDFQLFNNLAPTTVTHFADLVNAGTYNTDATFYRIIQNFMDQGGVGGTGATIPVELNPDLRFTSSGLLALANNGVDGNGSEFFITNPDDMSNGFLDFRYTVFGKLISGDNVRAAIASTPVTTNSNTGEDSQPLTAPKILSMSITTDTQDGVFMLKALSGATGTYNVTVSDGLGGTQNFSVTVGTNSFDPPNPWIQPINGTDQIFTAANTPVTFTPQGMSADGSAVTVNAQVLLNVPAVSGAQVDASFLTTTTEASDPAQNPNPNLTITQNGSSWTITPAPGFFGVTFIEVTAQSATAAPWDATSNVDPLYRALVPVFVAPPTPTLSSITSGGQTISGSTFNNNSSASTELSFHITGAVGGATVSVFADGGSTAIATGTVAAGATSATITTDGSTTIGDGAHTFSVKQTIATQALTAYVGWTTDPTKGDNPGTIFGTPASSLDSAGSGGTPLTVGLSILVTPITSARVQSLYTFTVQTNAPSGDTITVTPVTLPAGMTFDGSSTFSWTPTSAQLNTSPTFEATVTDSHGRTATIGPVDIAVILGLTPTQVPVNATTGGDVTIAFNGNNVLVYNNLTHSALSNQSFKSTDIVEVDLPAGQSNSVMVMLPTNLSAAIPHEVYVNGVSGTATNSVLVFGTAGTDNFFQAGNTTSANGLQVTTNNTQTLDLAGMGGDNNYQLKSSSVPLFIVNTSNQGTLDFSQDTAGVTVNLGLYKGQAQFMSGWNSTIMLYGVLNEVIGTSFADSITGGAAAATFIHSGLGNDTIVGGSGNNILVGGGGNDSITGGLNRNLLIAGSGTSSLYANGSMNIAFGGSTNFDANDQALLNLLNQGPFAMFGYSIRRALASASKSPSLLSSLLTLQDSGAHDTIFGQGPNNWFTPGKNGVVKP